jgi:hypothetical protein
MRKRAFANIPMFTVLSLAFISMTFLACGRQHSNHRSSGGGNEDQAPQLPPEETDLSKIFAALGLRSFDEVTESFGVVTTVDPNTPAIKAVFDTVRTQLPNSNDIKSFLASHQVGVSKLAIEYCDALMIDATKRAAVVPGFQFTAVPSTAFGGTGTSMLIAGLVDKFWGVDLENLPDAGESSAELDALLDALLAGENMGDVTVTAKTAKGVCAAVLSSAPVMIF